MNASLRRLWLPIMALLVSLQLMAGAQTAVYVPPTPSVSNVTGLPLELNSRKDLIASSNETTQIINPYHLSQIAAYNTGTPATALFIRKRVALPYGVANPRFVFTNFWTQGNTAGEKACTGPLSPVCAFEDASGNIYPMSFNGSTTGGTITSNTQNPLQTDPVPIYIPPVSAGGPGYAWERIYVNLLLASYTDLTIDATTNTKVSSVARPFTASDVGCILRITAGTGFTTGSYTINSVTGGVATLSASAGTLSSTGGTGTEVPDIQISGVTNSTIGDSVTVNPTGTDPATITPGAATSAYGYWATCVVGKLPVNTPAVWIAGDSITVVAGGYISGQWYGTSGNIPWVATNQTGNAGATLQHTGGIGRAALMKYGNYYYREMGANDFRGLTSVTAQNLIDIATYDIRYAQAQGLKVILQTMLPYSTNAATSLNVWTDAQASQTPQSNDAARRAFNDWLRGMTIAAINAKYGISLSAGTLSIAQLGVTNPTIDAAALMETDVNNNLITVSPTTGQSSGGYYRVPTAPAATLTAAASTTSTSVKGTFTANAYNQAVIKFTSGVATGMYSLVTATSTSALTLSPALGATPGTGDSYQIWFTYTSDGTHPSTNAVNGDITLKNANITAPSIFTFNLQTSASDLSSMLASTIFRTRPRTYRRAL